MKKALYVPILTGNIQGPLEKIIKESTYGLLRLPFHLLSNEEVKNIGLHMVNYEKALEKYFTNIPTLH